MYAKVNITSLCIDSQMIQISDSFKITPDSLQRTGGLVILVFSNGLGTTYIIFPEMSEQAKGDEDPVCAEEGAMRLFYLAVLEQNGILGKQT